MKYAGLPQFRLDRVEDMIRQNGDEKMPVAPELYLMVDRPESEFGFHGPKGVLYVEQHVEDVENFSLAAAGDAGADHVISGGRPINFLHDPLDADRVSGRFVLLDADFIAVGHAGVPFLQSADSFDHLVVFFSSIFHEKRGVNLLQFVLESPLE